MSKRIFFVATFFATMAASAQDTANKTLDEVIVSANKFLNKTSSTGKVVTVITQQDIERAGSKDLAQLITEQGGVYLNGAFSNPGKDKSIYVRGGRVEHTLITIDGVPVYDASGIGSNFDIRLIPIESVARIEILKGSQSTLYGSDAIAGVINIITKRGGTKPVGGSGSVSYGSFNTLRTSAGIHGVLKKLDYNIGANYFKTDGISEAERPLDALSGYDRDGFTQKGMQASVGIQALENLRIQPYLRYSSIGGDLDQQAFVDEQDYSYTAKNFQAGVRNELSFGAAKLNVLYNYNHINRNYLDDSAESRNGFYIFNKAGYKAAEHFAEAYIVYPFGKLKLTAGADFRSARTDYDAIAVSPPFPPYTFFPTTDTTVRSGDSVQQKQVGIYSALHYSNGMLNIEAGGRYNHHSVYGSNGSFNFNPSLLVKNSLKLFANLSSGYKTPSLYQLYTPGYGNTALKPEKSINIEGGMQYFFKQETGSIRATYFYRNVRDVIFFLPPYINQDRQKDHGVELESKLQLAEGFDFKLFYTYSTLR